MKHPGPDTASRGGEIKAAAFAGRFRADPPPEGDARNKCCRHDAGKGTASRTRPYQPVKRRAGTTSPHKDPRHLNCDRPTSDDDENPPPTLFTTSVARDIM